jgi:tRNA-dihydrouridine synthase B
MAGVTDLPFRKLCREMDAGLVVSEMVASEPSTWSTRKSILRIQFGNEPAPRSVQIAGYDPEMMAEAARFNVQQGADIIDINMGCPAKKVCKRAAGSALLKDPKLVEAILRSVVSAVNIPVTLKIRTGWNRQCRNAVTIAKIAEDSGVKALAVHGRTRECRFLGTAEYDTIAQVVDAISIPVIANGDITDPQKAASVLTKTGASAVMIGRGAQGNPWIFKQIKHYLECGEIMPAPDLQQVKKIMSKHLASLHEFYGETSGVKLARKHMSWYSKHLSDGKVFSSTFNQLDSTVQQKRYLHQYFKKYLCQEQIP